MYADRAVLKGTVIRRLVKQSLLDMRKPSGMVGGVWVQTKPSSRVRQGEGPVKALVGFLVCMLLTVSVYGQTTNGSIQGTVTDSSGATLSRATVTARNLDTGLTNSTVTTDAGLYSLSNLPPGRYS